jgi:hypothetical protein
MEVSSSAYYAWRVRGGLGPSVREQRDVETLAEIKQIHAEHPDYGSPRVARRGTPCNHKKVEATMIGHGIVARRRGLTKPDESAPALPDLVGRLFDTASPRRRGPRSAAPPAQRSQTRSRQSRCPPRPRHRPPVATPSPCWLPGHRDRDQRPGWGRAGRSTRAPASAG